jgi:CO/xanthine dehydrogenase FAD-binding subunit
MAEGGYAAPATIQEAVALLSGTKGDARVMAGGTDVLVQLHSELIDPDLIVDIKRIGELRQISGDAKTGFRVGAAVTGMELMDHEAFRAAWPGVIEGVALIGSIQVKYRATVAGNLCNASPAADSVPAMIAAGAVAVVAGPSGTRELPIEKVAAGPGRTTLQRGEIITGIVFPPRAPHSGDSYMRLTPRTEMDIAVVGAGVSLTLDGNGVCTAARVALGAVAPTAILVPAASAALVGTNVDDAALARMAAAASAACAPISDKRGTKEYRIKTAAVIARRVAEKALERARGN